MRLNRCMDKTEEEILLEACRKQDAGAYKRLYDLYAPRMFALCLRYAGSRADAEDMLHDGFVHIFEHIKNQEIHRSLTGWIRKVMVNTAISYLRKTWVRQYEDMEVAEEQEKGEDYNYEPYDTEILLNAIKGLPDRYRVVFNLYEIEGFSFEEIAETMGLKVSGVRAIYYRAKQLLVTKLGDRYIF